MQRRGMSAQRLAQQLGSVRAIAAEVRVAVRLADTKHPVGKPRSRSRSIRRIVRAISNATTRVATMQDPRIIPRNKAAQSGNTSWSRTVRAHNLSKSSDNPKSRSVHVPARALSVFAHSPHPCPSNVQFRLRPDNFPFNLSVRSRSQRRHRGIMPAARFSANDWKRSPTICRIVSHADNPSGEVIVFVASRFWPLHWPMPDSLTTIAGRSSAGRGARESSFNSMSPVVASMYCSPCCPLRSTLTRRPTPGNCL
jgi:hypothetical protein